MILHNRINRDVLKAAMQASQEARRTLSFYKYHQLPDPHAFRDYMYEAYARLGVLGRVYIAREGVNAQISVPEHHWTAFKGWMDSVDFLRGVRLNIAVEDDGKSFFKLKIKVRAKIVADGLDDAAFDSSQSGTHLDAAAFNEITSRPETLLVDMRNHYESEVGHFEGAICPDVDTFRESLPVVVEMLAPYRDRPVVMYCTGGIRCEKASAWLRHNGFQDVYQLDGGIIQYARQVQAEGLPNKFKGTNFVFDERLGERISGEIIAHCHQCGTPYDHHVNCRNVACNLLFIQCPSCAEVHEGCCSPACQEVIHLPEDLQRERRKGTDPGIRIFSKGRITRKG
ncbi:MAG: rhodanese-related sulfurtransferase [Bacteroidia bacterium]|nr:rhodanese-related sulfurtransferase [Bacteroidia bacterium]